MRWSLERVADVTLGACVGSAEVDSVVVDSRHATAGSLFVALRGEHADGHDYIADALSRGAVAVLCESGRSPDGVPSVEVVDPLDALRLMAEARRAELTSPVVAITGSSGKTTTKDLIAAVLQGSHAAPRSFNNEIGVPLTVLSCPDDAAALVVEVGSRGPGHIALLADAVRPDVAVITNIGRAHLETFGSVDGVLAAKWELVEALGADGVAVLPATDHRLAGRHQGPTLTFGESSDADVAALDVTLDDTGCARFEMVHQGTAVPVVMATPGRHQAGNATAAVAAAVAVGLPFAEAAGRLAGAAISPWRMESFTVPAGGGTATILNDAYNANPDSMASALATLIAIPGRHRAVLGKMHELGLSEAAAHREAGALAAGLGCSVLVVGDDPGIAEGAGGAAISVGSVAEAIDHLRGTLAEGDVVLVKASRAVGLEAVAHALQEVGS